VLLALLVYVSSDGDSWRAFVAPLRALLVDDSLLPIRVVVMIVLLATEEDVKEELAIIMKQQIEEVRLIREEIKLLKEEDKILKDIENEEMTELRLIRKELEKQRYK